MSFCRCGAIVPVVAFFSTLYVCGCRMLLLLLLLFDQRCRLERGRNGGGSRLRVQGDPTVHEDEHGCNNKETASSFLPFLLHLALVVLCRPRM